MRRLLLLAVALLISLNGCSWIKSWGADEDEDAPAKLIDFQSTVQVGKVWSASVGSGLDKAGRQIRPVYSSGSLYAADYKGAINIY